MTHPIAAAAASIAAAAASIAASPAASHTHYPLQQPAAAVPASMHRAGGRGAAGAVVVKQEEHEEEEACCIPAPPASSAPAPAGGGGYVRPAKGRVCVPCRCVRWNEWLHAWTGSWGSRGAAVLLLGVVTPRLSLSHAGRLPIIVITSGSAASAATCKCPAAGKYVT